MDTVFAPDCSEDYKIEGSDLTVSDIKLQHLNFVAVRFMFCALLTVTHSQLFADDPVWDATEYYNSYLEHGYDWENLEEGVDSTVPPPWSDISVSDNNSIVEFGGGEIHFEDSLLPEKILVNDKNILSNPIQITLKTGDAVHLVGNENLVHKPTSASKFSASSVQEFGSLSVETTLEFQYDGFMLYTLEFLSDTNTTIDGLELDMKLDLEERGVYSRYIEYDYVKQKFNRGSLRKAISDIDREINSEFTPMVSLENSDYGLEWIAETNSSYSLKQDNDAIFVSRAADGVYFKLTMVNQPLVVGEGRKFQFALFPFPSRESSGSNTLLVSRKDANSFRQAFGKYCCVNPVYFGNQRRISFETVGLPKLSNKDSKSLDELSLIDSIGKSYAPYTALHMLSTSVEELKDYVNLWESSESRTGGWGGKNSGIPSMQPVSFEHKSLADFMLLRHTEAIREQGLRAMYFDIAGMTSLSKTMERTLTASQLESGFVYYPFFGLREFAKRYWKIVKSIAPDFEIFWHTGAILPKSITTYTDFMIFGESFHYMFSDETTNAEFDKYNPDYFALEESMFRGPLSQKNGFSYMLIPQLKRGDKPEFTKKALRNKTRSLLAFSLLHKYPVWDTKLSSKEYISLLRHIDKFGGLHDAKFKRDELIVPTINGVVAVAEYSKDKKKFMVVVNRSDRPIDRTQIADLVKKKYGEELSLINSFSEITQVNDFIVLTN